MDIQILEHELVIMDHLNQHGYGQLFQPYPHYVNYDPNLYTHRRIDDDDFEPPRHSTWN